MWCRTRSRTCLPARTPTKARTHTAYTRSHTHEQTHTKTDRHIDTDRQTLFQTHKHAHEKLTCRATDAASAIMAGHVVPSLSRLQRNLAQALKSDQPQQRPPHLLMCIYISLVIHCASRFVSALARVRARACARALCVFAYLTFSHTHQHRGTVRRPRQRPVLHWSCPSRDLIAAQLS